jgi:hypothetical protein
VPVWDDRVYAISYFPSFRFTLSDRGAKLTSLEREDLLPQRMRAVATRSTYPEGVAESIEEQLARTDWRRGLRCVLEDMDLTLLGLSMADGEETSIHPTTYPLLGKRLVDVKNTWTRRSLPCPGGTARCRLITLSSMDDPDSASRAWAATRTKDEGRDETWHRHESQHSSEVLVEVSSQRLLEVRFAERWDMTYVPRGGAPVRHFYSQRVVIALRPR